MPINCYNTRLPLLFEASTPPNSLIHPPVDIHDESNITSGESASRTRIYHVTSTSTVFSRPAQPSLTFYLNPFDVAVSRVHSNASRHENCTENTLVESFWSRCLDNRSSRGYHTVHDQVTDEPGNTLKGNHADGHPRIVND